ncbi:hypothetical protein L226DRAFT_566205 [Lentinus tigrinus ALCF2SS1-7]|uniref:Uncharacterized protein n=1 Tax=Lentinus tigrinus ALCF2SS1-6 TaxID=1328759 RepID=A0A5C2SX92_9APHY|nr:hypothetical protein L227DRAFT_559392 [Lentinus tigrinus ALCF2SS1-6]RPD81435.1 hypothetical protein L226DRAFT_566205 [Lentinus tigrinus ALCF2SS1-7]
MAATLSSPPSNAYTVPSLKYYFTPATFKEVGHSRSRPGSSSSNSSYGNSASSSTLQSTALTSPSSDYVISPSSATLSPSAIQDSPGLHRLSRPLPTPPTTPQSCRASLPPRPLPDPPLHRTRSTQHFRADPLPTPPASGSQTPPPGRVASSSALPTPPAEAGPSTPRKTPSSSPRRTVATPGSTDRPSIRLDIPATQTASLSAYLATPTPLSPIAFNLPGPRDLRRRREEELDRRMKELGFVESPRSPRENAVPSPDAGPSQCQCQCQSPSHDRKFSISSVETDEDRDVVLLVDHDESDAEHEYERPPTRSQSRAAMLTLFGDVEDTTDTDNTDSAACPWHLAPVAERDAEALSGTGTGIRVDVEVEVVTKEAVARTKRRFSRKWIRERKGKRWTEQDFSEVIAQLRKLR